MAVQLESSAKRNGVVRCLHFTVLHAYSRGLKYMWSTRTFFAVSVKFLDFQDIGLVLLTVLLLPPLTPISIFRHGFETTFGCGCHDVILDVIRL